MGDPAGTWEISSLLHGVHDLERLNGRISLASAGAKDLVALRESLLRLPAMKDILSVFSPALLQRLNDGLDPLPDFGGSASAGHCGEPSVCSA